MAFNDCQIGDRIALTLRDSRGEAVCVRYLHLEASSSVASNQAIVVSDTWIGELIVRVFRFLYRHWRWVVEYDKASLNFTPKEFQEMTGAPMYSGTYWYTLPYRFSYRFFKRVDLQSF